MDQSSSSGESSCTSSQSSDDEADDSTADAAVPNPDEEEASSRNNDEVDNNIVHKPHPNDVLLGRGKYFQNFPGNQRMLRIVAEHKERYMSRKRQDKRPYVDVVLNEIVSNGARFLKKIEGSGQDDQWEPVEKSVAFEKVHHAIREKKSEEKETRKRKWAPGSLEADDATNRISSMQTHTSGTGDDECKLPAAIEGSNDPPSANRNVVARLSHMSDSIMHDPSLLAGATSLHAEHALGRSLLNHQHPAATSGLLSRNNIGEGPGRRLPTLQSPAVGTSIISPSSFLHLGLRQPTNPLSTNLLQQALVAQRASQVLPFAVHPQYQSHLGRPPQLGVASSSYWLPSHAASIPFDAMVENRERLVSELQQEQLRRVLQGGAAAGPQEQQAPASNGTVVDELLARLLGGHHAAGRPPGGI